MKFFGATHIGMKRSSNQDAFTAIPFGKDGVCAVLCDGMGGVSGGQIASSLAVETIAAIVKSREKDQMDGDYIKSFMLEAIDAANRRIYQTGDTQEQFHGMGTTLELVICHQSNAYIAHIGDSRVYLLAEGDISQVSRDHSLVQEMIERGELTPEQARAHPRKNIITRALGAGESVDTDFYEMELFAGDLLLLCSDGLTNMVEDDKICKILQAEAPLDNCPQRLIEAANAAGGTDNITVVVIKN